MRAWIRSQIVRLRRRRAIKAATALRGGPEARELERKKRQLSIRREKDRIISGLFASWRLGEIRKPPNELHFSLKWFHKRFTIERLRALEKEYWG